MSASLHRATTLVSGHAIGLYDYLRPLIHRAFAAYPLLTLTLGCFAVFSALPLVGFLFFAATSFFIGLVVLTVIELTLLFWAGVMLFWALTGATFLAVFAGIGLWMAYSLLRRVAPSLVDSWVTTSSSSASSASSVNVNVKPAEQVEGSDEADGEFSKPAASAHRPLNQGGILEAS